MMTNFLGLVLGWYLVIFSLLIFLRHEPLQSLLTDLVKQKVVFFVIALITLIMGLLMTASHNIWVMGWPVVITILSWLILIGGLIRLFFPDKTREMATWFLNDPKRIKIAAIFCFILGLFLLFKVYF